MLEPIDFLHDINNTQNYLLEPNKIQSKIAEMLEKDNLVGWNSEDHRRFALLNRTIWAMSVLDTIDDYHEYTEYDITTFFLALNLFDEIIDAFENNGISNGIFGKTLSEGPFGNDVVENKDDYSFTRFIRSLSVAHSTSTNRGGRFLRGGNVFVLSSIDTSSAAPTDLEIAENPEAFYFHVIILKDNNSSTAIFKLYIDELKEYIKQRFDSCEFEKLKV